LRVPGIYLMALACEIMDKQTDAVTQMNSGHSLKHLPAALAVY